MGSLTERISMCTICRDLDDLEYADYISDPGSTIKPSAKMLTAVAAVESGLFPNILRCPQCGTYYRFEYNCGFMEHDESYQRLTDDQAMELLKKKK